MCDLDNMSGNKPNGSGHPLFGCMKGMITILPGTDLTAPTCPHWDEYANKKYGPDSELGKAWAKLVERENARQRNASS